MSKKSFTYIPFPRILCTELYIRKQDIRIYKLGMGIAGKTAGPIGLKFFCGHSWVVGGGYRLKKRHFLSNFFFHWHRGAFKLVFILKLTRR